MQDFERVAIPAKHILSASMNDILIRLITISYIGKCRTNRHMVWIIRLENFHIRDQVSMASGGIIGPGRRFIVTRNTDGKLFPAIIEIGSLAGMIYRAN